MKHWTSRKQLTRLSMNWRTLIEIMMEGSKWSYEPIDNIFIISSALVFSGCVFHFFANTRLSLAVKRESTTHWTKQIDGIIDGPSININVYTTLRALADTLHSVNGGLEGLEFSGRLQEIFTEWEMIRPFSPGGRGVALKFNFNHIKTNWKHKF
jgi:hypothetical protein